MARPCHNGHSTNLEHAECFGDVILTARVPLTKIACFNTLLPIYALRGEGAFLVIGGNYQVSARYG